MLESAIQSSIKKKLEADGWIVVKLIKTSMNGIPDLLALKGGCCRFIEVKQPKGVISPIQQYVIDTLRINGFDVEIWTKYKEDYERKRND